MLARRLPALVLIALLGVPAFADEPTDDEEIYVPPARPPASTPAPPPSRMPAPTTMAPEASVVVSDSQTVSAAPPAFLELKRTSIAAGLGIQWGRGVLFHEGEQHPFVVRGVSVGDIGASKLSAVGEIENLERASDLEGTYLAVEAAVAAGPGRSVVRMRNEHGVVVALRSDVTGGQLTLGAEGIRITLED